MQRQIALWLVLASALNRQPSQVFDSGACAATSVLVILNVTVTDPNGNPVADLKPKDFAVTEDGKKQSIAVFAFQGPNLDPVPPRPGPNQLSGLNHRLITFLFDSTTISVRDDAIDFIRNDLKPGELLSIETVTAGSVETIQDFTADQTALVAAVNKLPTAVVKESAPLAGIATLCKRMPTATKKRLLYFSAAIEQPGADNQAALDAAANACQRANVAIDPIGVASANIAALATKTGGQIFPDRFQAIDRTRESRTYYVVGYYSTNDKRDGGYRNVEVKLTSPTAQQPKLDYLHGYFADLKLPKVPGANTPVCF